MSKASTKVKEASAKRKTTKQAHSAKAQKALSKKKPVLKTVPAGTRRLQAPKAVWYNPLTWHHRPPVPDYKPLPKARIIFWRVLQQFWQNRELFGGVILVYGILNLVLVRGLSGSANLAAFKAQTEALAHGVTGGLLTSFGGFAYLLSTSGSGNAATSGVYQSLLLLICSLAFIWVLRQTIAHHRVRIRDSFYHGMYPLIPFLLTFLLLAIQLLPLVIGGSLYSLVTLSGIEVYIWGRLFWLALFILLALWSLRMVTATIFALYIVTLPDMTPMKAYKSARQLVYGRRLLLWRKIIFLPVALLAVAAAIEIPLIFFATPLAQWVLFALSMAALPVVHGYLYNLYREML